LEKIAASELVEVAEDGGSGGEGKRGSPSRALGSGREVVGDRDEDEEELQRAWRRKKNRA
jgi:hypothetical protein